MSRYTTKYEPPEAEEALTAAEGLTADAEEQLVLAAALMGSDVETMREHRQQRKSRPQLSSFSLTNAGTSATARGPRKAPEVVVIKRRPRAA